MKTQSKILLGTCLILFTTSICYSQSAGLADKYWNAAQALAQQGKYLEAAQMFAKSAHAERESPRPRLKDLGMELSYAGYYYQQVGQYDQVLEYYEQALDVFRKLGREGDIATVHNSIGLVYKAWGQYDQALKYYEQALTIDRKLGREGQIAVDLNNIGSVYRVRGRYTQAIKYYEQALTIARKLGQEGDIASYLNNIGIVYEARGQYAQALKHFEQALAIARKLGQEDNIASRLNNIGAVYNAKGQYDQALKYYEQALTINRKLGQEKDIAIDLNNIGMVYDAWGQHAQALKYFEQALAIARRLGQEGDIASYLGSIGVVYEAWGQYDQALKYFEQALAIDRKLGRESNISRRLNNIGTLYEAWGQYDQALKYFEQALAIARKLGQENKIALHLNNIGAVYDDWGQYDQALKYYEQALTIDRKLGRESEIAGDLNNIGSVYRVRGRYNQAIKYYEQALAIARKLGQEGDIASYLNNIGSVYKAWGQYDQALKYYEQALVIDRKLGREDEIAGDLNNIGTVYFAWDQHAQAVKYLEQALAIDRKLGRKGKIAGRLNNIGMVYYELKEYTKAIENLENSIEIKEKLRKTATGDIRRDYLASQIHTYQLLTSTSIRNKDFLRGFNSIELSRAKLLAERLSRSESAMSIPSVEQIQKELPDNTTLLVYAHANLQNKVLIALTKEMISGIEVSDKDFLDAALGKYETSVQTMLKNQRGMKKIVREEEEELLKEPVEKKDDFENIINYYRMLLTNPTRENNKKAQELGRMFYDFLVKPVVAQIKDKTKLIIIPDGVLCFLPFETLIDDNEEYLAENYIITYVQSMGVLDLIRSRNYGGNRKPLLAFGGAVYNEVAYTVDMVKNERQLAYLENSIYSAFKSRGSVRNAYASLGVGDWGNLPGSLSEVKAIQKVVNGAEIITASRVTESEIKAFSNSGKLAGYKVLHFATHGLVVPAVPELSAIVLSQFKVERADEDGYLRMAEIADLKIQADFVNLSACETGLGKIYGGEGVVGLTQSFLIAGANGLSVSLWQVADVSTSRFMVAMYESVQKKGMGYADAITEVKRRFIKGDFGEEYRAPYYWAPFVYYGR